MFGAIAARCAVEQLTDDRQWKKNLLRFVQLRRILAVESEVVDDGVGVDGETIDHFFTGSVGKASSITRANSSPSLPESNPRRSLQGLASACSTVTRTFSRSAKPSSGASRRRLCV